MYSGVTSLFLLCEVSLWDLDNCSIMSVFTPDSKISCLTVVLDRKAILVGMSDSAALILKKSSAKVTVNSSERDLFREESTSNEAESEEN
ncbi:hypothetical protein G0U57_019078, partial [Chelydra serpentina]